MAIVLDSSVVVALERGLLSAEVLEAQLRETDVALSAIGASELLHGLHRLRQSRQRARAEAFVEGLLEAIPIIPFDLLCARVHARVGAELRRRGVTIGSHDQLIAATALANGMAVATCDARSFPRIPGLDVELLRSPA